MISFSTRPGRTTASARASRPLPGRLSADFFRTHRSYLVNLKAVVRIGRTSVLLRGGAEVPLARGKYDAINRAFIDRN